MPLSCNVKLLKVTLKCKCDISFHVLNSFSSFKEYRRDVMRVFHVYIIHKFMLLIYKLTGQNSALNFSMFAASYKK